VSPESREHQLRIRYRDTDSSPETDELSHVLTELLESEDDAAPALTALARHLPLIVWSIDRDGTVTTASGRGLVALGLTDDDLVGTSIDEWGAEAVARTQAAMAGRPGRFSSEGVLDGRPWAFDNLVSAGRRGGIVAVSIDVTAEHVARQALDESEGRFRTLADHAPVGIFLSDPDAGTMYTNAELQRQMGRSADELAAHGWEDAIHPDDLAGIAEVRNRQRTDGGSAEFEYRAVHADGSERWLSVRADQILSDSGEVLGIVGTSHDITERRQVVQELIASEERFRTVSESAPIGIFLADASGKVVYLNSYLASVGGTPDQGPYDWVDHIHDEDRDRLVALERQFRHDGQPFDTEFRIVALDGEMRWLQTHTTALNDDTGDVIGAVGTVIDITERHRAEDRRRESEELTQAILETAAEGIVTMESDGTILAFNAAAEQIFDRDSDDVIGENLALLLPEPHRDLYLHYLRASVDPSRSATVELPPREVPGVRPDGSVVPIEVAFTEVHWGGNTAFTALVRDVSERQAFEHELEHQATHDPLTALPNRALLAAQLESALARAYRNERSVAVLFISLDRMKMVTDSLGHRAGDELRVAASHRLQGLVRMTDTVTRFGENEFVILAEDLDDMNDAVDLAQRIIEAMDIPFDLTVDEAFIAANVGIAFALDGLGTAESLISDADVAMFRAKEQGGSHFEIFDSEMRAWVNSRRKTENALRHGLERDEFELHYQPIVDIESGAIKGFEALVRWDRPHLGLVAPSEFIPVAEESGIIVPMGEWILGEACRQAARWQADLPSGGLTVSVNLSGRQMAQRDIAETVRVALHEAGADPAGLVIELTETVLLDDVEQAVRTLDALRAIGVKLSMDDFGTGYSSLTYLRRFPIDIVKVDRSFVNQLGTDSRDASIVEMVVTLAHGLEIDVVAEGVETREQLDALAGMSCQFAQGYLFARPQPARQATALLARSTL
jgi:diguanylate cyclase (GGDEF)-like protein/PAS domain S-box-containing protein